MGKTAKKISVVCAENRRVTRSSTRKMQESRPLEPDDYKTPSTTRILRQSANQSGRVTRSNNKKITNCQPTESTRVLRPRTVKQRRVEIIVEKRTRQKQVKVVIEKLDPNNFEIVPEEILAKNWKLDQNTEKKTRIEVTNEISNEIEEAPKTDVSLLIEDTSIDTTTEISLKEDQATSSSNFSIQIQNLLKIPGKYTNLKFDKSSLESLFSSNNPSKPGKIAKRRNTIVNISRETNKTVTLTKQPNQEHSSQLKTTIQKDAKFSAVKSRRYSLHSSASDFKNVPFEPTSLKIQKIPIPTSVTAKVQTKVTNQVSTKSQQSTSTQSEQNIGYSNSTANFVNPNFKQPYNSSSNNNPINLHQKKTKPPPQNSTKETFKIPQYTTSMFKNLFVQKYKKYNAASEIDYNNNSISSSEESHVRKDVVVKNTQISRRYSVHEAPSSRSKEFAGSRGFDTRQTPQKNLEAEKSNGHKDYSFVNSFVHIPEKMLKKSTLTAIAYENQNQRAFQTTSQSSVKIDRSNGLSGQNVAAQKRLPPNRRMTTDSLPTTKTKSKQDPIRPAHDTSSFERRDLKPVCSLQREVFFWRTPTEY